MDRMLGFAVSVLRMSPEIFWNTGFREFLSILAWLTPVHQTMARSEFAGLMSRFPDKKARRP
jgi:hypothetical protein